MTAIYLCGFKSLPSDHGDAGVQYYLFRSSFCGYSKQKKVRITDV